MAHTAQSRNVHLFDSWAGLPNPSEEDGKGADAWAGDAMGSTRRVSAIMKKLGVDPSCLHFYRGWFQDTFPKARIGKIALLHIDADFYDSVKLCLERWFPHVSSGGIIQFDDYDSYLGCRTAVDQFLSAHPELTLSSSGSVAPVRWIEKP